MANNYLAVQATGLDTNTFFIVFGIYMLGMVVLGWWVSRGQKSGDDFLLGGRSVPLFLVLGTTVATLVGTGSSMGAVGQAYSAGWAGALFALGNAFGLLFLARFFTKARQYKFMTLAEEMSFYYGANRLIKSLVGVGIFLASVGWLGAHIIGGGHYLSWIAGIDMLTAKAIVALGFTIYVIIGGYTAVVWTDTIQAVVLFIGFIIMAVLCMNQINGWSSTEDLFHERNFAFLKSDSILKSLTLIVSLFISACVVPSFRQRIYSSKDEITVKRSFVLSSVLYMFFSIIPVIIGITAQSLLPGLEDQDKAFPELITKILPPAIGIIVLIAGLSAVISSASSDAIAGTSILLRDIFYMITGRMPEKKKALLFSRYGAAITSVCAFLFTFIADNIFDYIKAMVGLLMSGLFVCCMFGRFWKRATWQGGVAALAMGSVTAAIFMIFPDIVDHFGGSATLPSVAIASITCVLVSLLTPPNTVTEQEALEALEKEREAFT